MGAAAVLLFAFLGQEDTGEAYYKFPVGTVWTYERQTGDEKVRVVSTVVKQEKERTVVESKEFRKEGDPPETRTFVWYVEEGFLCLAEQKDDRLRNEMRVYRLASKKGDTWKSPVGGVDYGIEGAHRGTADVEVRAKTYKSVLQVRMNMGVILQNASLDFDLAPGVGMIRFHFKAEEQGEIRMELLEFKKP